MASVSQRRTRRQGSFDSQRVRVTRPKPRRWIKRTVLGLTFLIVVVLLLPTVVAYTPLRDAPLRMAMAKTHGTIHAGGASLSWFGPINFTDLEIRDAHGNLVLAVAKIESEKSLIGMLSNWNNLGNFRIEHPQVALVMRPNGSNIEDLLASDPHEKKPKDEEQPDQPHEPAKLPAMSVEITDGEIKLTDAAANKQWQLNKFNFRLRMSPESTLPTEVALSGEVPLPGRMAQLSITSAGADSGGLDHLEAKTDALPLAMFQCVANRFAPGLQIDGMLTTNLRCDGVADQHAAPLQVTGSVALGDVSASGGPLGNDRFALQRIELPCNFAYQNRRIDLKQLGIYCDVGQLGITGSIAVPEKFDAGTLALLARSAISVDGQLDLAKLAALLPSTLHVRSGTQITSGQVRLAVASKPEAGGNTWSAQITASDLTATSNGQRLALEQPISLTATARDAAGAYSLDQFSCTSSFLALSGGGTLDLFHTEGQCDLDRLMHELNQFVDLGEIKFAGHGNAKIDWQHNAIGGFQANAQAQVQGLQIVLPGKPVWQEDSIALSAVAAGSIEGLTLTTLDSAKLKHIDGAQLTATVDNTAARTHEQIDLRITPATATNGEPIWPIDAHMQGQLGRWWPRVAAWFKLDGLDLGGACDVTAQATYAKSGVAIQQIKASVGQLHAWGWNSLFIDEPQVQLEASGGYDFASNRLVLNRSNLLTSTVSLQTDSATVALPTGRPISLQGSIVYQADLTRLMRWISDPRTPPSYAMTGHLMGNAAFSQNGTATSGGVNASVENFAVYVASDASSGGKASRNGLRDSAPQSPELVWQEPKLTMSAQGGFDNAAGAMQLSALDVASQALALHAAGKITALGTQQNLDFAGKIDYDWQTLGPLLKPYLGDKIAIAGRQSRNFSVRGPLGTSDPAALASGDKLAWLRGLTADASLGWSQAELYNIRTGALDLDAHLESGTVSVKPIDTPIGDNLAAGRLTATPQLRLSPGPAMLVLGKGPLLTNVQISQSLNNPWVRFIAPILSEPARATGIVNIELDGAQVPLGDPKKADLGGRLVLRNSEITPGPLGRPLVLAARQIEAIVKRKVPPLDLGADDTSVKIDDQSVDFRMIDGRVYHQGLTMRVGDVQIRTRGWVDLDENVNLVAEIPLKEEWTSQRNNPLSGLEEPIIRIPITGNLKKPSFDRQVLLKLLAAIPRAAIEGELNKQLDRLFSPPQK